MNGNFTHFDFVKVYLTDETLIVMVLIPTIVTWKNSSEPPLKLKHLL